MYFLLSYWIHFPYPAQTEIHVVTHKALSNSLPLDFFSSNCERQARLTLDTTTGRRKNKTVLAMNLLHLVSFLTIICDPSHLSHASVLPGVFKIYLPSGIAFQHWTSTKHFLEQCYGVPPPMALIITAFPWLLTHKTILERTTDGFVQSLNQPTEQNAMFHLH